MKILKKKLLIKTWFVNNSISEKGLEIAKKMTLQITSPFQAFIFSRYHQKTDSDFILCFKNFLGSTRTKSPSKKGNPCLL